MKNINQNHSGKGDNVGRDKITNNILVKEDKLIRKAQEAYSKIYHWHKKYGRKIFSKYIEEGYSKVVIDEYHDLLDSFPPPHIAELDEMISICEHFNNKGILSWSSIQKIEPLRKKQPLIKYANEVLSLKKKFTAKKFTNIQLNNQKNYYSKSKEILLKSNKELRDINRLLEKRIGGFNVIIESSKEFDDPIILTPELLGYSFIEDNNNLVNMVRKGKIKIDNIKLDSFFNEKEEKKLFVELSITNLTNSALSAFVSEGQIFENRKYNFKAKPSQNLATSESRTIRLQPNEFTKIELPAFCMNYEYAFPEDKEGNLTFYEMSRKGFRDNQELWEWIKQNHNRIKRRFK